MDQNGIHHICLRLMQNLRTRLAGGAYQFLFEVQSPIPFWWGIRTGSVPRITLGLECSLEFVTLRISYELLRCLAN
ncbi:hypothetical protein TNCV_2395751 [Trichonephila clavipes]|nr:hypothetical protein TNCV_2395751 [Trichonephila clavipes]